MYGSPIAYLTISQRAALSSLVSLSEDHGDIVRQHQLREVALATVTGRHSDGEGGEERRGICGRQDVLRTTGWEERKWRTSILVSRLLGVK